MIEAFLVGVIATASVTAGLFFLKFWRDTRDPFFLSFASFTIEGLNCIGVLFLPRPHEGSPGIYLVQERLRLIFFRGGGGMIARFPGSGL